MQMLSARGKLLMVCRSAVPMLFALALSACGAVLPAEGPSAMSILQGGQDETQSFGYLVLPIDESVSRTLATVDPNGLRRVFGAGSASAYKNRIGIGDTLQITIWEAAESGLFSTADNKITKLPPMQVDKRGRITIPFVGSIHAAGQTPAQLQRRIASALSGQAISPQVLVTLVKNVANSVVVNGDVRKPGMYEMSLRGDRVLDVIALAGGAAAPARETMVTLIRGKRRAVQNLKRIIQKPSENIYVRPGDQIYLSHNPQTYTAFGAVAKTGEYPFDSDRVNILEAVARAGGLLDNRASNKGVFIFRLEDNRILRRMGRAPEELSPTGKTPTVYVLDMSKPRSFFLAQSFTMRDNDVIYVANSVSTELQKFLTLLNAGTGAIRGTHTTINQITRN